MLKRGVTNMANAPPSAMQRSTATEPIAKKATTPEPVKKKFIGGILDRRM